MVLLEDLMPFLDDFMGYTDKVPQIDRYLVNGLQLAGKQEIHKIATGVSANMRFFRQAVASGADALLVHHSMNTVNSVYFERDKIFMERMRYLLKHDLSLIGYHYLLDSHPQVGNNALIIRKLGGELAELFSEPFSKDGWGWVGQFEEDRPTAEVINLCRQLFQNNGYYYDFGKETIRRFVSISGGAPPSPNHYQWLMEHDIDLYITGEIHEWNQELCRESGINMVAGGHYMTETFGVLALGDVIAQQFDVEVEFIDVPNKV